MTEDATNIIMNMKQIPLKLDVDHSKTVYLEADQPGEIKSGNITPDPDIEILDPNVHIASIGEGGKLKIPTNGRRFMNEYQPYTQDTTWRAMALFDSLSMSYSRIPAYMLMDEPGRPSQAQIASEFDMTENAVKQAFYRFRQRYQTLLREEIAHTVAMPGDIEDELRHLITVVRA